MKNIKLIASDLDGTLLLSNHTLSDTTKRMWEKILEMGIHLVPVTGRTLHGIRNCIPHELLEYTVNVNGVQIFKHQHGTVDKVWDMSLEGDAAVEVIYFLQEKHSHLHIQFYKGEDLYALEENERTKEYTRRSGLQYNYLKNIEELRGTTVSKIMILAEHEELLEVQSAISQLQTVHSMFSMPYYLEIFNRAASKGQAVLHVAELLNIRPDEILGIGDSYNDIPMLEVSGHAYIMKNALSKLAPDIPRTEYTNDEDGVVRLIESLLGIKL